MVLEEIVCRTVGAADIGVEVGDVGCCAADLVLVIIAEIVGGIGDDEVRAVLGKRLMPALTKIDYASAPRSATVLKSWGQF